MQYRLACINIFVLSRKYNFPNVFHFFLLYLDSDKIFSVCCQLVLDLESPDNFRIRPFSIRTNIYLLEMERIYFSNPFGSFCVGSCRFDWTSHFPELEDIFRVNPAAISPGSQYKRTS